MNLPAPVIIGGKDECLMPTDRMTIDLVSIWSLCSEDYILLYNSEVHCSL